MTITEKPALYFSMRITELQKGTTELRIDWHKLVQSTAGSATDCSRGLEAHFLSDWGYSPTQHPSASGADTVLSVHMHRFGKFRTGKQQQEPDKGHPLAQLLLTQEISRVVTKCGRHRLSRHIIPGMGFSGTSNLHARAQHRAECVGCQNTAAPHRWGKRRAWQLGNYSWCYRNFMY